MTSGGSVARTVPSSGIVTWNSASSSSRYPSNSSSARSISSISRTAGRVRAGSIACSSGRLIRKASLYSSRRAPVAVQLARGLEDAQLDELPGVIPLVDRVRDVEPLVALQPDEVGLERRGHCAGQRGLPDAGLAFEEERPSEPEREEHGHGEAVVGDVVLRGQPLLQVLDRAAEGGVHAWCGSIARTTGRPAAT